MPNSTHGCSVGSYVGHTTTDVCILAELGLAYHTAMKNRACVLQTQKWRATRWHWPCMTLQLL